MIQQTKEMIDEVEWIGLLGFRGRDGGDCVWESRGLNRRVNMKIICKHDACFMHKNILKTTKNIQTYAKRLKYLSKQTKLI